MERNWTGVILQVALLVSLLMLVVLMFLIVKS